MSERQPRTSIAPVEVLMEDGSWEPGELVQMSASREGCAGLIRWSGITAWLWRHRGRGHVNEWRFC